MEFFRAVFARAPRCLGVSFDFALFFNAALF